MAGSSVKRFGASVLATLAVSGLLIVGGAAPAGAAATNVLVDWEMNEGAGAHTMVDSSGHGINGTIGSAVQTNFQFAGATGYHWAFTSPTMPPAKPERLVTVWNSSLNPGSGDYAVELRYRTNQHFGNIIQKAQGGSSGGYWKIENPGGLLTCVFRGKNSSGAWKRKVVDSGTPLSDNQWHTVKCERTATQLTLTVDGSLRDTAKGSSGTITNTRPISIAGKYNCDNVSITCDYFTGDIDWVKIYTG